MRFSILTLILLILATAGATAHQPSVGNECFSIVVGKNATADGSVILAHNEDDYNPQVVNHRKVPRKTYPAGATVLVDGGGTLPQVPETWSYIWSEIPGQLFSDSYLNEWGVCICSNSCPSKEDQPDLSGGGITYMLRRIVAERAKSAREAVHLAGMLIEKFGYGASGRTYSICDPNEGWVFCAVNGKHWVAERVPDNQVAVVANAYTIHQVDLSDTLNFFGSSDLIDYANLRGWYVLGVDTQVFDFAATYGDSANAKDLRNVDRQWDGFCQIAQTAPTPSLALPFAMVPKAKLGLRDIMAVLRRHYEGSDVFAVDSVTKCPHANAITPICRNDTQTSFVAQLRGNMPADLGLVYWVSLSSPCLSCYVPFYFGIDSFPASYDGPSVVPTEEVYRQIVERPASKDTDSVFWAFTRHKYLAEQRYTELAPAMRDLFDIVELSAVKTQTMFDDIAAAEYAQDRHKAAQTLSGFSATFLGLALDVLSKPLRSRDVGGDLGGLDPLPQSQ